MTVRPFTLAARSLLCVIRRSLLRGFAYHLKAHARALKQLCIRSGPRCDAAVFNKLQSFLPQLAAANDALEERIAAGNASTIDIEVIEGAAALLVAWERLRPDRFRNANNAGDATTSVAACPRLVSADESKPHVEMDVSLGVLDLKTDEAVAAAENATRGSPECLNDSKSCRWGCIGGRRRWRACFEENSALPTFFCW